MNVQEFKIALENEKNKYDEVLDNWISTELLLKFVGSSDDTVYVSSIPLTGQSEFISKMKSRGFNVEYYCEDRICGDCYYIISI